jgi:predicted outer membrane repeat protein
VCVCQCGKAVVNDNTFTRNKATRSGGGIFQSKCSGKTLSGSHHHEPIGLKLMITPAIFERHLFEGACILCSLLQACCPGNMDTNYFRLNSALNGGSVWQNNCKKIVHSGSRFDNNTSERGSAGIEMNQITSIDIVSCTFSTGKSAKGSGLYLQVPTQTALLKWPPSLAISLNNLSPALHACKQC